MKQTIAITTILASSLAGQSFASEISNQNYVTYPDETLIQRDLSSLRSIFKNNYHKFIDYKTPNGGSILLIATKNISDEQLIRAHQILDFYLTDVAGAKFGSKAKIANKMAENGAVLVMAGGSDGNSPIDEDALEGQPLYQLEFPIEGSKAYMNSDYEERDAGFEEILHLVHDYGIGTKYTQGVLNDSYQKMITKAMKNSLKNKLWGNGDGNTKSWLKELDAEGSLEQEYIASVLDSYYGLWGAWQEGEGGMWGVYAAKDRKEVKAKDPMGAELMAKFLPDQLTYMARIDDAFDGTFKMAFDPKLSYTHKSQYLLNASLTGDKNSTLIGNKHDNILIGNQGDNQLDGGEGIDVVQYDLNSEQVKIKQTKTGVTVTSKSHGIDHLQNIEILRFKDKDVALKR